MSSEESYVKRKLPVNLSKEDLPLFYNALERNIPAIRVFKLSRPGINSQSIIFEGVKISPESFIEASRIDGFKSYIKRYKFLFKHHFLRKKIKINDQGLWFTDAWSHEYFHWMTDALPRLLAAKDYIGDSVILLPHKYSRIDYVQKSLKVFGVENVTYIPERAVAWPSGLILPAHTASTGNYNEVLLRKLRELFREYYKKTVGQQVFGDRIYISRSKSLRRKISNEDLLVPVLQKHGFAFLYFEDFDFDQQVVIMSNAKYLISNHGAGLTNMLFMQQGGAVLELRRKGDNHNNCYFSMASALELNYYYQLCVSEDENEDTYTANLIVDIEQLDKNISAMLN